MAAATAVSLLVQAVGVQAQPGETVLTLPRIVPERYHRLIRLFDFEERALGNYEETPMHWYAIGRAPDTPDPTFLRRPLHQELSQRPGYPASGQVRFDTSRATSGEHSFLLDLDGGNVGAYLEVGTLPAIPGSDYRITVQVCTSDLKHAGARVVAYFVDSAGRRVEASMVSSPLIRTNGSWQRISLDLPGEYPEAAWIGLQLELVQPPLQARYTLGPHEIPYRDVRGRAWFDDLAVWQVPRVAVRTQSPVNVLRAPERPKLRAQIRDLTGQALLAHLLVLDERLQQVAEVHQLIGQGAPTSVIWSPPLSHYGWYLVQLTLMESTDPSLRPVARSYCAFLWLPPQTPLPSENLQRFILDVSGADDTELAALPTLLDRLRLAGLILSCWSPITSAQTMEQRLKTLDAVIDPFEARGGRVILNLFPFPEELADAADAAGLDPIRALGQGHGSWSSFLTPVLMRHAQRIRYWQIGSPDVPDFFYKADLPLTIQAVHRAMANLAPQPQLVVPWSVDQHRRGDLPGGTALMMDVPPAVLAEQIPQYLEEWSQQAGPELFLRLRAGDSRSLSPTSRIEDLVLRMLYAWNCSPRGLVLSRPWIREEGTGVLLPDPLLGVFTNLAHRLAGRKLVGKLPVEPGVECWVMDGAGGGMLVTWNRAGTARSLEMFLGGEPVLVDVWGNSQPLAMEQGRHRIPLSSMPVFVEGIDAGLALFRTQFRVSPAFLETTQKNQSCTVELSNPWPRILSGTIHILEPADWFIEPRRTQFTLSPGEKFQLPLQVRLPPAELAGTRHLAARLDLTADRQYQIDLSVPLELGLPGIKFQADLLLEKSPNGQGIDAVVVQTISNQSDRPLSLYAFAALPGFPRQERIIPRLLPGETAIRRFRFPGALPTLQKSDLRVGLREVDGPAMLNQKLSLEQP